ncbi:hypothetical protein [Luteimonas deserti]|uniref:Uncharacterized protein n=1 Tax=Luteimonas deserti TaxID=2752306 RepID=A0A7Z0QUB8_9GAMM|nr:hypothetical protein [Luteimonas deserti]NYZ63190.1 hypothetical protein [Luteimonas deserti]
MNDARAPSGSPGKIYTVTVYVAAPGTPIQHPGSNEIHRSTAGHVYYSLGDGQNESGYGFSPVNSGTRGPGQIVGDEFLAYRNPAYSRTMEISKSQYEALRAFGEAGLKGDERYFDLQYNGATNSCIDFTWGALNHAGLHWERQLPFGRQWQQKNFDGALKPLDNIRELQRIPDPMPDSPHNLEQHHPLPKREWWQRVISDNAAPAEGFVDPARQAAMPAAAHRTRFDDPVLDQLYAALQAGDSKALDRLGQQFNRSEEGLRLAERSAQPMSDQQIVLQREHHQEPALVRGG